MRINSFLFIAISAAAILSSSFSLSPLPAYAGAEIVNPAAKRTMSVCNLKKGPLNVRELPANFAFVITQLPAKKTVTFTGESVSFFGTNWYKITRAGIVGWVSNDYLCD